MIVHSLHLRLSAAAAGLIAIAMILAGVGLFLIFDTALDRRTTDELDHTARLLAGSVGFNPEGGLIVIRPPADPRYATPYGGLYWQIERLGEKPLRSRSLWDRSITLPPPPSTEATHYIASNVPAFDRQRLIAVHRTVRLAAEPGKPTVGITVAMDRAQLSASRNVVLALLPASLAAFALLLMLTMAAFVHRALTPLRALRSDLEAVHEGRGRRLSGLYPSEIQPLADDLNHLLGQQEAALGRARTQAADMAHGLKTPLAILDATARRIEDCHPVLAAEVAEQSQAMQEQVARTLARARGAIPAGLQKRRTPIAPTVEQVVEALRRLPGSERLSWQVAVPVEATCPVADVDLIEILGNLIDNARKWARTKVSISVEQRQFEVAIVVEDDGPGMSEGEIAAISRGRRWDQSIPGTGFGLAIACDLAATTGATLSLSRRRDTGVRAELSWRV